MIVDVRLDKRDMSILIDIAQGFGDVTEFPEDRELSDEGLWQSIVEQIAVIGRDEPAKRINRKAVSLKVLGDMRDDQGSLLQHVNTELAHAGVRYVSQNKVSNKASWIVHDFLSPKVVQVGKVVLVDRMNDSLNRRSFERERERELAARHFIVKNVKGFGYKSASDFLIQIGYAKTLIPFDSGMKKFINKILRPNILIEDLSPGLYELLEDCFQAMEEKAGIWPSWFDRIVHQHNKEIVRLFADRSIG